MSHHVDIHHGEQVTHQISYKVSYYLAYVLPRLDHSGLEGTMKNMQQTRTNVQCFLKPIGNLVVIYQVKYIPVCAGSIYVKVKEFPDIQIFDCIQDFFF